MPRGPRLYLPELPYHVICRGNNRNWVFHDDEDFEAYLDIIRRYQDKDGFHLHHWVLMNNHIHLLITPGQTRPLAKSMQSINLAYSIWHARKYQRVGHLWQGRFRSIPIEQDAYLLECGRYIERNPIRAGLTDDPAKYRWTSYHVHVEEKQDGLTEPHLLYLGLSNDPSRRKQLYRDYVGTDREHDEKELQEKMKSGFLGSDQFQHVIESQAVSIRKPRRGRPRNK